MNLVATILDQLNKKSTAAILIEMRGSDKKEMTAQQLLQRIAHIQHYLVNHDIQAGDRVVLIGENTIDWVATDLAIIGLGAVCVPLYCRQTATELLDIIHDCMPKLMLVDDALSSLALQDVAGKTIFKYYSEIDNESSSYLSDAKSTSSSAATIIYTSGTSGEPKGVVLTQQNIAYMCDQTSALLGKRLQSLPDSPKLLHYLPLCFAGSRIMLWSSLCLGYPIYLVSQLTQLLDSIKAVQPHYFLNVPAVLEKIKRGVEDKIASSWVTSIYTRTRDHYIAESTNTISLRTRLYTWFCQQWLFKKIKHSISKDIQFLICGSAPLNPETQRWFTMIGIPIHQVYGLTETTGIISIDSLSPQEVTAGYVGYPLPGCAVKLSEQQELWCKGPNIFSHYWNKVEETNRVMHDGWFQTGDLAEINATGNIRILGRHKELIVLESGHNVLPESLEHTLLDLCQHAEHIIVFGHGRPHLSAFVTGTIEQTKLDTILQHYNQRHSHYKKLRHLKKLPDVLSIENGLLTANGKIRRKAIEIKYNNLIAEMYQ